MSNNRAFVVGASLVSAILCVMMANVKQQPLPSWLWLLIAFAYAIITLVGGMELDTYAKTKWRNRRRFTGIVIKVE